MRFTTDYLSTTEDAEDTERMSSLSQRLNLRVPEVLRDGELSYVLQHNVIERRSKEQGIDPIQDAAVPGNDGRAVFDAGAALEHRLEQVSSDTRCDDSDA